MLKERFQEERHEENWRISIKKALMKEEDMAKLKVLKDYSLVKEELYRRMVGGILSRCVGQEKGQRKLREVHDRTCKFCGEVNLYHRLQRVGFYWPSMGKDADQVQIQCKACQLATNREESYAVFINEDWRDPFVHYLAEGTLPQKHSERYKFKKLAISYFLHNKVLFKKGYDGDQLRYLGLEEAREIIKEVHTGECKKHQGKKKLYKCLLQMGYYWPIMKRDSKICEKMPQLSSTSQLDSHSITKLA